MGNCGLPHQEVSETETKDESWCKRDRRVKLNTVIFFGPQNSNFIEAGYNTHLKGQRRRSCIWVNYKTDLEVRNSTAVLNVRMPNGTLCTPIVAGGLLTTPNFSDTNEYNISNGVFGDYFKPSSGNVDTQNAIKFSRVRAEGSSRGIGNQWAIINCNENL